MAFKYRYLNISEIRILINALLKDTIWVSMFGEYLTLLIIIHTGY